MEKNKKGKKKLKWIMLGISLFVAIGLIAGYFYYHAHYGNRRAGFPSRNFQLNESQINSITSFFSSNPTASEVQNYCMNNREDCFYYCRNINPNSEICTQIMNYTRTSPPQGGLQ